VGVRAAVERVALVGEEAALAAIIKSNSVNNFPRGPRVRVTSDRGGGVGWSERSIQEKRGKVTWESGQGNM
jgi:hypothetical protein